VPPAPPPLPPSDSPHWQYRWAYAVGAAAVAVAAAAACMLFRVQAQRMHRQRFIRDVGHTISRSERPGWEWNLDINRTPLLE
jgi:hypothetical protein